MKISAPRRGLVDFVRGVTWDDIPVEVRTRTRLLLRDFAAVSLAGRPTAAARVGMQETRRPPS